MATEESENANRSKREKIFISLIVYYATFILGLGFNFLSPTNTYFKNKFGDEDVSTVSIVFSIGPGAYFVGSFIYLGAAKLIGRHQSAIISMIMVTLPLFFYPHVTAHWQLFALAGFQGVGAGCYDPAQVAWIIDAWGGKAGPWILGQHFAYSVGTIFAPLVLSPFLDDEDTDSDSESTTTAAPILTSTSPGAKSDQIWIPFTIGGCTAAIAPILLIFMFFYLRRKDGQRPSSGGNQGEKQVVEPDQETSGADTKPSHRTGRQGLVLLILSCIFIGGYQGMEMDNIAFMPTFAEFSDAKVSKAYAADISTGLTSAFATGRALGIILVLKLLPEYLLCGNFTLMTAGTLVLFFMGSSRALLWTGAILLGLGFSTTYPSYFAFIEKHLEITDFRAGLITICGGFVAFVYPFIVGDSIETNPRIMSYVSFFSLAIVLFSFGYTYYLTVVKPKREKQEN